ncbi:MAG: LysR family transcriptional regulator [Pseudomonadales bacterium]|jgi:DNA-binding transcriptional LysR family regulator|nr:LysR family transcriptional regulator [Pseudomonadales bacterium]
MLPDLRRLRHVVAVAEAGSLTAAARGLAISQPALTRSIAELEQHIDLKLFHRLPRGVQLTDVGEQFVRRARRVLADAEDLMEDLDGLRDLRRGRLRIAVAPAAFISLVDSTVAAFARLHPGVRIEVLGTDLEQVPRLLADGVFDIVAGDAHTLASWTELETETIAPLHDCVIARPDHPLRDVRDLELRELMRYPVVLPTNRYPTEAELAEVYRAAGLSPRPPQYRCDSVELVRRIVLDTDAIAPLLTFLAPRAELHRSFLMLEEVMPLPAHALGLAVLRRNAPAPTVSAFRELARAFPFSDARAR